MLINALIVSLLVGSVQEDGLESTLEALLERVNALEAFHVVFDFHSTGPEGERHSTLELAYRAPDQGCMRLEDEEGVTEMWFGPDGLFARRPSDNTWGHADRPEWPAAAAELEALFPRKTALGPGLVFFLHLESARETDTVETRTSLQQSLGGRDCPLAWLKALREHVDEVEREGFGLVLEQDGVRTLYSSEHGFPLRIDARTTSKTVEVRLSEIQLDDECPPEALALPAEAAKAEGDANLERLQAMQVAPPSLRRSGFERVQLLLDGDALKWTALTRSRWNTVLTALHRPLIEPVATRQLEQTRSLCAAFAEHLRQEREKDDSRERLKELREYVATNRDDLAAKLDVAAGYLDQFPPLESKKLVFDDRLLETEREVAHEIMAELLVNPALAVFDEAMEGIVGD